MTTNDPQPPVLAAADSEAFAAALGVTLALAPEDEQAPALADSDPGLPN